MRLNDNVYYNSGSWLFTINVNSYVCPKFLRADSVVNKGGIRAGSAAVMEVLILDLDIAVIDNFDEKSL